MAKKKGKFRNIHIHPMAGTHYSMRHEPEMETGEGPMPMMPEDGEKNEKLFAHGERANLHKHLDELMDAHEGKMGDHAESDADDMPMAKDHPMNRLKKKW